MPLTLFSFVPYGGFYVCSDGEIYSLFFFISCTVLCLPALEAGECLGLTQGEFPQWVTRNLLNWTRWSKLWQTYERRISSCSMLISYKCVLLPPSMVGFLELKNIFFHITVSVFGFCNSRSHQVEWSGDFWEVYKASYSHIYILATLLLENVSALPHRNEIRPCQNVNVRKKLLSCVLTWVSAFGN